MSHRESNPTLEPRIRVGIGGWKYEPWCDNFYPKGWSASRELEYASRKLTSIEVDGTYYRQQKPETFAKWYGETPDDFVFSLKAIMYATNRRDLAQGEESARWFLESGITQLKEKLGPIVWQFMPTKQFRPVEFERFLRSLPSERDGWRLRHVLDVRHESFRCAEYIALARAFDCTTVFTDSTDYPALGDSTGPFVYLRLMGASSQLAQGFQPDVLDQYAACARWWRDGNEPDGLPRIQPVPSRTAPRDVFVYFINGAKEKAPHAAMALIERLA